MTFSVKSHGAVVELGVSPGHTSPACTMWPVIATVVGGVPEAGMLQNTNWRPSLAVASSSTESAFAESWHTTTTW